MGEMPSRIDGALKVQLDLSEGALMNERYQQMHQDSQKDHQGVANLDESQHPQRPQLPPSTPPEGVLGYNGSRGTAPLASPPDLSARPERDSKLVTWHLDPPKVSVGANSNDNPQASTLGTAADGQS